MAETRKYLDGLGLIPRETSFVDAALLATLKVNCFVRSSFRIETSRRAINNG